MKIFLSHAAKDNVLAADLAKRLIARGLHVWLAEEEIAPGDNWAKKTGQALDESELMVFLLTPGAMKSEQLRQDVEFAIGSRKFQDRVFTVFVGPTLEAGKDVPWILFRLPFRQVESARGFGTVVKQIEATSAGHGLSQSNA